MSYSVHYVEKVRSTDYSSYYSNLSSSTFMTQNVFTPIGKCEQGSSVQKQTTVSESFQHMNNIQATVGIGVVLNDAETREKVWRMFFPDKPLPRIKANAVEEYYGALDKFVDWKKINPKELKRKMRELLDE